MKAKLTLLLVVLLPLAAHAADDLSATLQKGLFEEEANQNLPAAIKAYESLLSASDEQRKLAATALFRLGECYRKLGRTNDAVAQYQRLLRDFTDQPTLATLSRQNLRGLGIVPARPAVATVDHAASEVSPESRERLRELLEGEIQIAVQFAREQRKKIEAGVLASGEEIQFERDVLGLKRQLVAVDGLATSKDRREWRDLLLQEIALAEKAVVLERQKLENGKSVASEVARLQRDVLILKREQVAFETTPQSTSVAPIKPATSIEAEELARTERILVQLSGRDLGQVRRLLPTVAPDADFEQYDRLLVEAQEKARTLTGEARDEWRKRENEYTHLLERRFDQIKGLLTERAEQLRVRVAVQKAEAGRRQSTDPENPATNKAQRAEAAQAEALLKQLQSMHRNELIRVLPTAAPDPLLNSLLEKLAEAERNLAALKVALAGTHPDVKSAEATINSLNAQITEQAQGILKGLSIKAAALRLQVSGSQTAAASAPASAEDQEILRIQALIKDSPDLINAAGKERTPLHVAAAEGKLAVVRFLLDSGAKPDVMTTDNQGPALLLAAENGHKAVVELLLARGADPNIKDGAALQAAAANGFMAIVDVLLANKADIDRRGDSGTALHRAVYMKRGAIVERLLKDGANVNALSRAGETPLHIAARLADAEMIKLLLRFKADIDAKTTGGEPPLWKVFASSLGNVTTEDKLEATRVLLENGASTDFMVNGSSPVHGAVGSGMLELVELMLKHKAAPDLPNLQGFTPLQVITLRQNNYFPKPKPEMISRLVAAGANPNRSLPLSAKALTYHGGGAENSYGGYPPQCAAIARGDQEVVEALLASGADVNAFVTQGLDRYTALMHAVGSRSLAMVEAVLKYKPDMETKTGTLGRTALHQVANQYGPSPEVISALAKTGANVDATDNGGWTPLHIAVEGGRPTTVKALLEAGANPNAMTASGAVPLSIARRTQGQNLPSKEVRDELVQLLLKHGADETIPRRRTIIVTRRGANYEEDVYWRGTNDFNRFSLYEFVARIYQHGGPNLPTRLFPDLRQVAIQRIGDGGGALQLVVNLESRASAESCTNDLWLEWGDRIEIREKEHPLNATWAGLDGAMATNISRCISRSVSLVIKGRTNQINLAARVHHSGLTVSDTGNLVNGYRISQANCGLNSVIQQSGLLLTTSDLSRVRVTRRDSQSGKSQEWILDETKFDWATDFWLRDGDVIEVPEKGANTEPAPAPTGGIQPGVSPLQSPPTRSIRSLPVLPPPAPPEQK